MKAIALALLLIPISTTSSYAQCISDLSFIPDFVSVAPTTSTASFPPVMSAANFLITDDFTVADDLLIEDGCVVRVRTGRRIIVNSGAVLTITSNSLVTDCDGVVWSTIEIQPSGKVVVLDSDIEHAETGITSTSDYTAGLIADFEVRGSAFTNNDVGILVQDWDVFHPGIVESTVFASQAPLSGAPQGFAGIWALRVGGIFIGNADVFGSGSHNEFSFFDFGIHIDHATATLNDCTIQNNFFHDISPTLTSGFSAGVAMLNGAV